MARPTHRLDIHYVPTERDAGALERVQALYERWAQDDWVTLLGRPVPGSPLGEFARVRVDDPGALVLYANGLGGFKVHCAHCSTPLARAFQPLGETVCTGCGVASTAEELTCMPPVAVGRASLVLVDAQQADVPEEPGFRVVWRRV